MSHEKNLLDGIAFFVEQWRTSILLKLYGNLWAVHGGLVKKFRLLKSL